MQGTVSFWDPVQRVGLIEGDDGLRYRFSSDAIVSAEGIAAGVRVEFVVDAGKARRIAILRMGDQGSSSEASSGAVDPEGASARDPLAPRSFESPPDDSQDRVGFMWAFRSAMRRSWTARGRASRTEYWGFTSQAILLQFMFAIAVWGIASIVERAMDTQGPSHASSIGLFAFCLAALAMLPAAVTITIRRLHDIGLSGWFGLLLFLPGVGWLFGMIVPFVPSSPGTHRHGPRDDSSD